jgi:hypothetical protein
MTSSDDALQKRFDARLWASLLAGPLAWILDFQTSYTIVSFADEKQHTAVLLVLTAVAVGVALGGAALANSVRKGLETDEGRRPSPIPERTRFMARAGLGLSLAFAFIILAHAVPKILLRQGE